SSADALTIGTSGRIDLTRDSLRVDRTATPPALVRSYLITGYAAGAWTGNALTSSSAASDSSKSTALGYADGVDGVVTGLDSAHVLIKYTKYGDANLDGKVGLPDFGRLRASFGKLTGAAWDQGDFNYDGKVNLN